MKNPILTISGILLVSIASFSQSDSINKSKYIKTYLKMNPSNITSLSFDATLGKFSKKGNLNEISISNFRVNNNRNASNDNSNLSLGIEFTHGIKVMKKKQHEKWSAFLGFGAKYIISKNDYKSNASGDFKTSDFNQLFQVLLAPKAIYNLSNRVYLDFSLPLTIGAINFVKRTTENPILTAEKQKSKSTSFSVFGVDAIKLGLGLRF